MRLLREKVVNDKRKELPSWSIDYTIYIYIRNVHNRYHIVYERCNISICTGWGRAREKKRSLHHQ